MSETTRFSLLKASLEATPAELECHLAVGNSAEPLYGSLPRVASQMGLADCAGPFPL